MIEEALPGEDCDQLLAEMAPFLDATPHGLHGLGGTRRCVRRTPPPSPLSAAALALPLRSTLTRGGWRRGRW